MSDFYSIATFNPNTYRIDLRGKYLIDGNGADFFGWRIDGTANNIIYSAVLGTTSATNPVGSYVASGGVGSTAARFSTFTTINVWHDLSLWVIGTTGYGYRDGTTVSETDTKYDDFLSANLGFSRWEDVATEAIDDIRVRKYASPEPSASMGAEETKP